MSRFSRYTYSSSTVGRSLAVAALGAAMLAGPLAPALAQSTAASHRAAKAEARAETVEQRITTLHSELQITPAEETDWKAVAQTMRDNAASMQKLAEDKMKDSSQDMTAVDDLQTYATFAQAHVDNLKKLIGAFQTLYNAMPDAQKKVADEVFAKSRHSDSASAG
jgi:hypothetical protein